MCSQRYAEPSKQTRKNSFCWAWDRRTKSRLPTMSCSIHTSSRYTSINQTLFLFFRYNNVFSIKSLRSCFVISGHLLKARFPCKNCKVKLSYRSSTGRTVKCPCCSSWGPMPSLKTLVCGGCNATIIYQKDDRSVKCFPCKHISHPQVKSLRFSLSCCKLKELFAISSWCRMFFLV